MSKMAYFGFFLTEERGIEVRIQEAMCCVVSIHIRRAQDARCLGLTCEHLIPINVRLRRN
jgi:hypothetical protein